MRDLRERMDSMLFERTALSKKPEALIKQELTELASSKLAPNLVLLTELPEWQLLHERLQSAIDQAQKKYPN